MSQPAPPQQYPALQPEQATPPVQYQPQPILQPQAYYPGYYPPQQPVVVVVNNNRGPNLFLRFIWFIFIGWWLGGLCIMLGYWLCFSIIGLPIGLLLLNRIPAIMTLKATKTDTSVTVDANGNYRIKTGGPKQYNLLLRALYFVFVGWWISGLWCWLAYLSCLTILGLPLGILMFDRLPAVLTLRRNKNTTDIQVAQPAVSTPLQAGIPTAKPGQQYSYNQGLALPPRGTTSSVQQPQPTISPELYQAYEENRNLNNKLLLLAIVWFLPGLSIIGMIFVNSSARSTNAQALVTPTSVPTIAQRTVSTFVDTPVPTTATPRPTITPLLPIATNEWGIVRFESEVKAEPSASSRTVEKLKGNTLVAWEKKSPDNSWYMRVGGGWINRSNVNFFASKEAAQASILP